MKKIISTLIVMLLLVTQVAAVSAVKLVRLEVINNSGDVVRIRLEGHETDAFYYLTVGVGETTTYTIQTDKYSRTTWACGYVNKGALVATSNLRLKFTECDRIPVKRVMTPNDYYLCRPGENGVWLCPNYGEPGMEKVAYFRLIYGAKYTAGVCAGMIFETTFRSPKRGLCYFRYRY